MHYLMYVDCAVAVKCMLMLVDVKEILCAEYGLDYISYPGVTGILFGQTGRKWVDFFLCLTQFGVCA